MLCSALLPHEGNDHSYDRWILSETHYSRISWTLQVASLNIKSAIDLIMTLPIHLLWLDAIPLVSHMKRRICLSIGNSRWEPCFYIVRYLISVASMLCSCFKIFCWSNGRRVLIFILVHIYAVPLRSLLTSYWKVLEKSVSVNQSYESEVIWLLLLHDVIVEECRRVSLISHSCICTAENEQMESMKSV